MISAIILCGVLATWASFSLIVLQPGSNYVAPVYDYSRDVYNYMYYTATGQQIAYYNSSTANPREHRRRYVNG